MEFVSQYHLRMARISRVPMRDLEVHFDEKLTFKNHVKEVVLKMNRMYGMAYRFTRDIKSPKMIVRVLRIYVSPPVEYGAFIWSHPHYVDFHRRMDQLEILTMAERRTISSILRSRF